MHITRNRHNGIYHKKSSIYDRCGSICPALVLKLFSFRNHFCELYHDKQVSSTLQLPCGVKYAQERSTQMAFKLIRCSHRHCVFTIDEELRHFFLEDRSLLDCLFQAVRSVFLRMFHNLNKSKNFVPGFVCVLHSFGRPLEWNPHIHCLITEGGFSI